MTTVSGVFQIRDASQLPFYCSPIRLFLAVWFLMLAALELHISYTTYPEITPALRLCLSSLSFFLLGYATVHFAYSAIGRAPNGPTTYRIDSARLRRFQTICLVITFGIVIFNWVRDGLPPLFGFFGAETLGYTEYGSFKQLLFPAVTSLFLTAPLDPSRFRRWFLYAFGPTCALVYASRGYLLIMLFQFLVVFSMRTTLTKRKIYLIALSTLGAALGISNLIGNGRSSLGIEALLGYLQIKRSYYDWPGAYLWFISYVSTPISNLCWIVAAYRYDHPSASFLKSLVPVFWNSPSLEVGDLGSENIVDGVHTYVAKYYLDFWWFGVFGINYIYGLVSGYIAAGNRLTRNYLTSAVLLGCIGFMFFSDFLTILMIVVELIFVSVGYRYFSIQCVKADWGPSRRDV
jgi:hypothetical protein